MNSFFNTLLLVVVLLLVVGSHSCWSFSLLSTPKSTTTTMTTRSSTSFYHQRRRNDDFRLQMAENDNDNDDNNDKLRLVDETAESRNRRDLIINVAAVGLLGVTGVASWSLFQTSVYTPSGFQRLPNIQFIAALGDPKATQGSGAQDWGLWRLDPGPRGVFLKNYQRDIVDAAANGQNTPAGWKFDANDWWLEEHGIIMEAPKFPLTPGRYLVTGGRMVTTGLTVDKAGNWKLDEGTLYDVTHLPCRSARYVPNSEGGSPLTANARDFPVTPGAEMPKVAGCDKQDYAVLFLVGKEMGRGSS